MSENRLCISIILNLLMVILYPRICSIYLGICSMITWKAWLSFCWVECSINVNQVLSLMVSLGSVRLLIFYLILSNDRGILKSPTIILDLSLSSFGSIWFTSCVFQFCLVYTYLGLLCPLSGLTLVSLCNVPLCLVIFFALKPIYLILI